MKRTFIGISLLLVLAYLAMSYYFSSIVLNAPRRTDGQVRELIQNRAGVDILTYREKLPKGEGFTVNSRADDIPLIGTYFRQDTSRCAVVLSHGYGNVQLSMMKYAHIFWECGCDVVVYDHRAHGKSGGDYATGGTLEAEDLHTITNWLKQESGLSNKYIGWMGSSWGGAAVLQAGANDEDVAFIISDSPFQNWETAVFERAKIMYGSWIGLVQPGVWAIASLRTGTNAWGASALIAAPKIQEPVLLLHSQTDEQTNSQQSVNISKKLLSGRHEFHHLNWGAGHCKDFYVRPQEFRQLVLDFIWTYTPEWKTLMDCSN